ncbi:MAG: hypothetical protein IH831_04770 [Planctomycetes bacterium]|nr:hypothetical protein [Planctomycetota bacterium]
MRSNFSRLLIFLIVAVFLLPDVANARRRRSTSSGMAGSTFSDTGPVTGVIRKRSSVNRTEYDYNWAARRDWFKDEAKQWIFPDKVRVKLLLKDDLVEMSDQLVAKIDWIYRHHSKTPYESVARLQQDGEDVFFDLEGLEEGRVVSLWVHLYRPKTEEDSEKTAVEELDGETLVRLGKIHLPYHGATGSDSNEEWETRARIISFAFSQWYVDHAYGGRYCNYDCYSFYKTSVSSEMKGFQLRSIGRSTFRERSQEGMRTHGDFLIKSGHYGMAVCYDEDTGRLCTIEGNYGMNGPHRINLAPHRSTGSWHTIRHIEAEPQPAEVELANAELAESQSAEVKLANAELAESQSAEVKLANAELEEPQPEEPQQ